MKTLFLILTSFSFITAAAPTSIAQTAATTEDGIALYRQGKYDESANVFREVVSKDKKDKLAWLYLGAAYLKVGQTKDANAAFKKSRFDDKSDPGSLDARAKIISNPRASYTSEARDSNTTGAIKIAVELKADGTIGFVFPFQTLPYGLTDNAVNSAKRIKFEPAVKDGKPVLTIAVVEYTFSISIF